MENHDYLSCRKEIREWEFGRGLLNGWATVFGVLDLLTIIGRTALLFGQYQTTVIVLGYLAAACGGGMQADVVAA